MSEPTASTSTTAIDQLQRPDLTSNSRPVPVAGPSTDEGDASLACSDPSLSNTQRDKLAHRTQFAYGNYHNYYSFRTEAVPDARLQLLDRALFAGRAVLDLGCNAGKLTIESLTHLGASRAVGIDIDPVLIAQAHTAAVAADLEGDARLLFVEGDFMQPSWFDTHGRQLLPQGESFEIILLLSITKWLHLHAGDAGLLELFDSLAGLLPVGGALVVEPQEWANYRAAVRKAKNLRPVFQSIQIKPDFEPELEAVGLVLERKIARDEGGFSRPLMVWRKR